MANKFIQSDMKLNNVAKLINGEFKSDISYIGWRIPPYQDTERLMFDMWGGFIQYGDVARSAHD